jgi:hypothetical protein
MFATSGCCAQRPVVWLVLLLLPCCSGARLRLLLLHFCTMVSLVRHECTPLPALILVVHLAMSALQLLARMHVYNC